ncbi:hypothetical protein MATL_G00251990 [Megalops atlanticus]|uniref:HMG box domain-containing protein n=1 Tax=Megalops atlanticus TaxID=7932 RepID=A0A9D3SUC5_MEGAT|nr:hypothetical protein MATL_G00251990 [Megalops atlanticus]
MRRSITMELNFYSDLSDGTGQHSDSEFMDSQPDSGYDSINKFPGGSDNYLSIPGASHPFLSSAETFHTPSLGDEEFEIPPISLDPDSTLTVSDVVSHFGELGDGGGVEHPSVSGAVVGGDDPSFASPFASTPSQSLEHLSLGVMSQPGGGALLSSTLGMDLGHTIGSHFSSSSPMTIDVPLSDMNHGLLGHNQLTTIDQSELSSQLGLSLGGGAILTRSGSPDQPLSATPSPSGSLQDEDMEDFKQKTVLVDSPAPLSVSLSPSLSGSAPPPSSAPPTLVRRGGGKPAMVAVAAGGGGGGGGAGKKGKKKKDPNEPQKPVSAYALFFRDTQAAIKGQNPSATFGEVSKIVASMWDSLGEEQKQVYKRKTEAAKKEYLKALAAYKANQLSQASSDVMDSSASPPPAPAPAPAPVPSPTPCARPTSHHAPDQNTITNICTSNIILDLPQVTTRSRTGAHKAPAAPPAPTPAPAPAPNPPTVTKIIISKQMLARGAQLQQVPGSVVTAKPRGGGGATVAMSVTTTPPPPLQIKIVPAPLQAELATPIIVTSAAAAVSAGPASSSSVPAPAHATPALPVSVVTGSSPSGAEEVAESEEFPAGEMEVELNVAPGPEEAAPPAPRALYPSRLHQPPCGEQGLGQRVLQQRVCGHPLQRYLHGLVFHKRTELHHHCQGYPAARGDEGSSSALQRHPPRAGTQRMRC